MPWFNYRDNHQNQKVALVIIILTIIVGPFIGYFYLWQIFNFRTITQNFQTVDLSGALTVKPRTNFDLVISKLNIDVPVIQNVDGTNKNNYTKALQEGVAHYKGTALPGETGNIFIFGHSSSLDLDSKYNEIFKNLNDLENGDAISIFYQDKNYQYQVFQKAIIEPDDLSVLDQDQDYILTLMTCWPIGTTDQRLVVRAKLF